MRWALANLTELYVLGLLYPASMAPVPLTNGAFAERAVQRARDLVDRSDPDSFEVYSTRRQLLRYDDWYQEIAKLDQIGEAVGEYSTCFRSPSATPGSDPASGAPAPRLLRARGLSEEPRAHAGPRRAPAMPARRNSPGGGSEGGEPPSE